MNLPVPAPKPPTATPPPDELLRRLEFLRDRLGPDKRMAMIGKLLVHLRDSVYPWMRILQKSDGTLEVTISRPPAGAE